MKIEYIVPNGYPATGVYKQIYYIKNKSWRVRLAFWILNRLLPKAYLSMNITTGPEGVK